MGRPVSRAAFFIDSAAGVAFNLSLRNTYPARGISDVPGLSFLKLLSSVKMSRPAFGHSLLKRRFVTTVTRS
jgi:hypothetical protein